MTISSEVRKAGPFSGNDVTTAFSFSFKVFSTADVLAVSADSLGLETDLTEGVDYTVSLNANQNANPGGTVTLTSPLATGYTLVLTSQVQYLQPTDLTNQGGFYPAVINAALDRATIQIQQLSEKVDRSAKLPITRTEDVDALLSDIVVLADNLTSVNTVAGSIGSVNKVAGVSADVSTVAGNIANINAAVADLPALSAKVSKTGDTMTGHLSVPAGASGAQVPQAQEVVPRAGNVTMTGPLSVPALNGGQLAGMRNKIINGKMEIAQRGTGGTSANTYTVDRWILFHAGTAPTWSRVSGGALLGQYFSNLIEIAGVAGNTGINFNQRIESLNSADLCGKTVTFSAYVLHTNTGGPRNFVITAQRPNTADNWSGVTSIGNSGNISVPLDVWTRITWTTTLPASGPHLGLSFEISCDAVAATQGVYITGAQLEAGSVATPFEHRPYSAELALCQRYCYAINNTSGQFVLGSGWCPSTTQFRVVIPYPVTMRALATATSTANVEAFDSAVTLVDSGESYAFTTDAVQISVTTASATQFRPCTAYIAGAGRLVFSAEL